MKYVASTIGPGMNITAATTQNVILYNPASATMSAPKVYEFSIGPAGNSADNTYVVRAIRSSTTGTFTNSITPSPLDAKASACVALCKNTSSAAATVATELGRWGFHMRGGYRWVAIPGGELVIDLVFSHGITWDTTFAQGSDVMNWNIFFDE
ncbi:MAG TPA: hypothetical protein VLC46_26855 [Thermoanaerobaculia bacterium]|jgi:hypothetical protein|nr:hypothetical protein [Thermoanaerobaculia bacterium]